MNDVEFSSSLDGVDWAALQATLAADQFDNGRTPQEYRRSHERSHAVVFGRCNGRFVANGRILSDGVCNAYLVDIWTASTHRRHGIGREVVTRLLATVPGQHVALFTDDMPAFYTALGFRPQHGGMHHPAAETGPLTQRGAMSGRLPAVEVASSELRV